MRTRNMCIAALAAVCGIIFIFTSMPAVHANPTPEHRTIYITSQGQWFKPDSKTHQFRYDFTCLAVGKKTLFASSCYVIVTTTATIHVGISTHGNIPYDNQNIWIYETITNDYKVYWSPFNWNWAEAKLVSYDKFNSYYPTAANIWIEQSCSSDAATCGGQQVSNRAWNGSYEENVYMQIFNGSGPVGSAFTMYARTKVDGYGNYSFGNTCTGC